MPSAPLASPAFPSFAAAAEAVLEHLHSRLGLELSVVARLDDDDWVLVHRLDHALGTRPGMALPWADTLCYQMVQGHGPRVAPRVPDVPAYAGARAHAVVPIGAYVGVPLTALDGSLFGTLCAISVNPTAADLSGELPAIELHARLLSSLLDRELVAGRDRRRRHRQYAETSGALSPVLWDDVLELEQDECLDLGTPAQLARVHAPGALPAAVRALLDELPDDACVGRTGPDTLGVLLLGTGEDVLDEVVRTSLEDSEVDASVTGTRRAPAETVRNAWERLDGRVAC